MLYVQGYIIILAAKHVIENKKISQPQHVKHHMVNVKNGFRALHFCFPAKQ
mgnify:CR=1 FL=1